MYILSVRSLSMMYLFYLVMIPSFCASEQLDDYTLDTDTSCGLKVEQPFSYSENRHGLQVICDFEQKSMPMIKIGRSSYILLNISLEGGYITILAEPMTSQCIQRRESPGGQPDRASSHIQAQDQDSADYILDLEGTPFTYSSDQNKLTVLGCDALVVLENSIINGSSGCLSYCPNKKSIQDGKCSGAGCCQSSIPPGLKSFNLTRYSIKNLTASSMKGIGGCTQFFVADMEPSQFKSQYVTGDGPTEWPVVLEWAIGNKSCETAMHEPGYACLGEYSSCHNVTGQQGYRCNCREGFEGNPYALGGCYGRLILC